MHKQSSPLTSSITALVIGLALDPDSGNIAQHSQVCQSNDTQRIVIVLWVAFLHQYYYTAQGSSSRLELVRLSWASSKVNLWLWVVVIWPNEAGGFLKTIISPIDSFDEPDGSLQ